jgi:hypothetical protein
VLLHVVVIDGVVANQVSAIMYEISILIWELGRRCVTRFVNWAKTSEERAMLETPVRARQTVPRICGLWGMGIYRNKVLEFLQSNDGMSLSLDYGVCRMLARRDCFQSLLIAMPIHFASSYFLMVAVV